MSDIQWSGFKAGRPAILSPTDLSAPAVQTGSNQLELPADGTDCAPLINKAIADAVAAGRFELRIGSQRSGKGFTLNAPIVAPASGFRLIGEGCNIDQGLGTYFIRTADVSLLSAVGTSSAKNGGSPSGMIQSLSVEGIGFQGNGFSKPMLELDACYQVRFVNVSTLGWGVTALRLQEVWDSTFVDCQFEQSGNGGVTSPYPDLDKAIARDTGIAAVELFSPNQYAGQDTTNNIRFRRCRWESTPMGGSMLRACGGNGVMLTLTDCKLEGIEGVDPLIVLADQSCVEFQHVWLYGGGHSHPDQTAPCLLYATRCNSIRGTLCGGWQDGTPGQGMAGLGCFAWFDGCDAPAVQFYALSGLTALSKPQAAIVTHVCTGAMPTFAASPWAQSLNGGQVPGVVTR